MSALFGYQRFVTSSVSERVVESAPSVTQTELPQLGSPEILIKALRWLQRARRSRLFAQRSRRLRISETVSLGEKRFVSIIQVDDVSFLIGSSAHSVTLLAKLPEGEPHPFRSVLSDAIEAQGLS